ncbi:hypothetical protein S4A8_02848 [Salinisphaera sp. S4-8]
MHEVAQLKWARASSAPLSTGDRVCTWSDNMVGNVEQVGSDSVKVALAGRVRLRTGYSTIEGILYNPFFTRYQIAPMDQQAWLRKDRVGLCDVY